MGTGGFLFRKARAKLSDVPTGFVWVENGRLAGSGYPSSRGQLEWLVGRGITAVLTLTPESLPQGETRGIPIEFMHLPMEDHEVPGVEALAEGAEMIRNSIGVEKTVLVHCLAGEGRTGCVLAAYLMADRRMTAGEALSLLRKIKPQFVEPGQERALGEFELSLAAAR